MTLAEIVEAIRGLDVSEQSEASAEIAALFDRHKDSHGFIHLDGTIDGYTTPGDDRDRKKAIAVKLFIVNTVANRSKLALLGHGTVGLEGKQSDLEAMEVEGEADDGDGEGPVKEWGQLDLGEEEEEGDKGPARSTSKVCEDCGLKKATHLTKDGHHFCAEHYGAYEAARVDEGGGKSREARDLRPTASERKGRKGKAKASPKKKAATKKKAAA